MSQGHIYIHGNIGSYANEKGEDVKGVELLDVISQVKSQPTASAFLVHIGSPGGLVDAGNQIYDYLQSLIASGITVDTISDSYTDTETGELKTGVGSIATKIFLSGKTRSIVDGHEFFIHNPWTQPQPGDSVKIKLELKALEQTESELRAFYQQHTKVTDTGLKGLMDNETGMNADQAVTLGFATRKVASQKIKAFALLNNNNMSKENQTLGQKIDALTKSITKALGATPGDEPGAPEQKLPDGEYPLMDGRVLVVVNGEASIKGAAAQQPDANAAAALPATPAVLPTVAPVPTAAEKALQETVANQAKEIAAMKEEQEKALKALTDFQNTMVAGKSPVKGFNNNGTPAGAAQQWTHKSINARMAEKAEERKNYLNKN